MKRSVLVLVSLLCTLGAAHSQTRRALILGIDTYQPAGTTAQHDASCTYGRCELGSFENLEGAVNDAQSMADLLSSPKFGFPADNIALLTNPAARKSRSGVVVLPADQTTHDGILAAMRKYLVDVPQKGDTVVFYDASHGSLRVNPAGKKLTVRDEGGNLVHVDSTLVPSDAYKGGYDVRDREMTRIFNAALDKGIHLTVIFDSCHSGGSTRGLGMRQRSLPYDPRPVSDAADVIASDEKAVPPTERTDNPALVFAAVQQDQAANDADPTPDMPESHGAFTAALVETLEVLPADTPASLVYQRVKAVLEGNGVANQEPDLDANATRRAQPLFGGTAGAGQSDKVRTAALKVDSDGSVWLDIGMVSGIGAGSEFTSINGTGTPVKLRIDKALGVGRSSATVLSPAGATVRPGDVFELSKLMPEQSSALRFWVGDASLPAAEIADVVAKVMASGVITIADPAEQPYTDVLSWNGTSWMLKHISADAAAQSGGHSFFSFAKKKSDTANLGAAFTSDALKAKLSPQARLWVNVPPSREMVSKLSLADTNTVAQKAATMQDAAYVLAGSIDKGRATYTWFHKNEYSSVPKAPAEPDHSPGCSATSPYPVRADWVSAGDDLGTTAASLNTYSARLAKVHGWLQLANNAAAGASESNYFNLALVPMTTVTPIDMAHPVHERDSLRLALQSETDVKDARWIYVIDIDCHGKGSLIYPQNSSENQYPSAGDNDRELVLRHAPTLRVGAPFGVDTLVLLSTAQPLPDPAVLNFEGVTRGATRGVTSPLEQLLSGASSGTRGLGAEVEVPTNWGIQTMSLRSVPKGPAN
jgi:hypothetical protein